MAANEPALDNIQAGVEHSRADVAWIALSFALCGGLFTYLFAPYLVPGLKAAEPTLVIVGVGGAIVFAVLGILLDVFFQGRRANETE